MKRLLLFGTSGNSWIRERWLANENMTHLCHWKNCRVPVPPRMWGCKAHWLRLPKHLRELIWATYVPGQENRKDPSPAYLAAIAAIDEWIRKHG